MEEDGKQEVAGEAELIIAKQRNGPVGEVPLVFLNSPKSEIWLLLVFHPIASL